MGKYFDHANETKEPEALGQEESVRPSICRPDYARAEEGATDADCKAVEGVSDAAPTAEEDVTDPKHKAVEDATNRIRERRPRMGADIVATGKDLKITKEKLPHGEFGPHLQRNFGWSERMAQQFMNVADVFGAKPEIIAVLTQTACCALAAPSTPPAAREALVARIESGERLSTNAIKEAIDKARPGDLEASPRRKAAQDAANKAIQLLADRMPRGELAQFAQLIKAAGGHRFVEQLVSMCDGNLPAQEDGA